MGIIVLNPKVNQNECIRHRETIIPITNILKRHEVLFMMDIDPIVLQNTKLKRQL